MSDPLWTMFRYELRMLLRDTRTILITVVAPLVLFPVVIVAMRAVERNETRRLEETAYRYAIRGTEAEWARRWVERARALEEEDSSATPVRFEEAPMILGGESAVDSLLEEGVLHVVIEGMTAGEWERLRAEERAEEGEDDRAEADDSLSVPVMRLEYRASSDFSRRASERLQRRLREAREQRRDSLYRAVGLPVEPERVAAVDVENAASAEKEAGAMLGLALTPFLLFLMLTGGSVVAADAISGEKERGTLETLLTTAATRAEIVTAKQLAIVVVGLAVVVVNVANLLVYLVLGVFDLPENFAVALNPWDPFLLLVLLLPLTVLISSALLLLSGYAKSYKEYQIYFLPLFLVFLVPSLAALLPGMDLHSAIALVPVSGVGVAVREVMVGEYDWPFLGLAFLSTAAAALGLARLTERTLSTERLISHADLDEADLVGGPALFPRHVLRWFLVLWALFYVGSLWIGNDLGIRGQIVVNLVVLFFGASVLMIRRYRLPVRKALALRAPHPAVWLAVLVGAPSAFAVGVGLAEVVNTYVFPVPQELIEAFGETLTEPDLPLWQLLLFLSIMPGFFEEIAFRGLLLHGLHRKLRPVALCLVVGAVFGLFHVALFRILPTAYLGAVLAAVTLLSGSLFPAMVWHAINNAVALVPAEMGWLDADATLPWWTYPVAAGGLAVAFWILWRYRRPYPGLLTGGKGRKPVRAPDREPTAVG